MEFLINLWVCNGRIMDFTESEFYMITTEEILECLFGFIFVVTVAYGVSGIDIYSYVPGWYNVVVASLFIPPYLLIKQWKIQYRGTPT